MKFFKNKKKEEVVPVYNRFDEIKLRLENSPFYAAETNLHAPLGYFDGRPLIAESNPIIGGVYLSVTPREAIVVDEKYGDLAPLYDELLRNFVQEVGSREQIEDKIFPLAVNLVKNQLRFDPVGFRNLISINEIVADSKVSLDFFLKKHVGVSRHQVLCLGYLLHKLKERELIAGNTRIDPIFKEFPGDDEVLVYTNPDGKRFLFDPIIESEKHSVQRFQLYQGFVEHQ